MSGVLDPTKVLIVDDDADQRFVLRRLFRREGITEVFEAADGDRALVVARAERPDLVLLDLAMPGRSGVDVLPELRDAVGSGPDRGALEPGPPPVGGAGPRARCRGVRGEADAQQAADQRCDGRRPVAGEARGAAGHRTRTEPGRPGCCPALRPDLAHRDRCFDARRRRAPHLGARHQRRSPRRQRAAPGAGPPPRPDPRRGPRRRSDAPRPPGARRWRAQAVEASPLLEQLSTSWGVEAAEGGKAVWFEVPRRSTDPT